MGWLSQKVLPIRQAPCVLNSSLYGISTDNIKDEFLEYLIPSEKKIITDALCEFDEVDKDELIDVLSSHYCKVRVTKDNILTVVEQIANKELVQEL